MGKKQLFENRYMSNLHKLPEPIYGVLNNAIYTHQSTIRNTVLLYGQMDYPGNMRGPCQISRTGLATQLGNQTQLEIIQDRQILKRKSLARRRINPGTVKIKK